MYKSILLVFIIFSTSCGERNISSKTNIQKQALHRKNSATESTSRINTVIDATLVEESNHHVDVIVQSISYEKQAIPIQNNTHLEQQLFLEQTREQDLTDKNYRKENLLKTFEKRVKESDLTLVLRVLEKEFISNVIEDEGFVRRFYGYDATVQVLDVINNHHNYPIMPGEIFNLIYPNVSHNIALSQGKKYMIHFSVDTNRIIHRTYHSNSSIEIDEDNKTRYLQVSLDALRGRIK